MTIKTNPLVIVHEYLKKSGLDIDTYDGSCIEVKSDDRSPWYSCKPSYCVYHADFKLDGDRVIANIYSKIGSDIVCEISKTLEVCATIQLPKRAEYIGASPC
jgi:hypothetical protein